MDADVPALRWSARSLLVEPPILLTTSQAAAVSREFHTTAEIRGWDLPASAVMGNHVHVVVGLPSDDPALATRAAGTFKAYASRTLNARWRRRKRWWTQNGSTRVLVREEAVLAAVRYVSRQRRCLALVIAPAWAELLGPLTRTDDSC